MFWLLLAAPIVCVVTLLIIFNFACLWTALKAFYWAIATPIRWVFQKSELAGIIVVGTLGMSVFAGILVAVYHLSAASQ